jgi:DNA-binding GntR family transcriptional regulator
MSFGLNDAVLIGAGAVGNAILRALGHVNARGVLPIVDPKFVGGGETAAQRDEVLAVHRDLANAIADRDVFIASALMEQHFGKSISDLLVSR